MRHLVSAAIGAGSMVAAWLAFHASFADEGFLGELVGDRAVVLVPSVVIAAGILAALVDRGPRSYAAVVGGAVAAVLAFAGWNVAFGPGTEIVSFAAVGVGLAISMLTLGFVTAAAVGWLVQRLRRPGR
jgi:hypothetical protein